MPLSFCRVGYCGHGGLNPFVAYSTADLDRPAINMAGRLTYRVMAYDALSTHASKSERAGTFCYDKGKFAFHRTGFGELASA